MKIKMKESDKMFDGEYKINLASLSILCYILVLIGHLEALILVAGFIIVMEKNEKAIIQAVQAVMLILLNNIIVVAMTKVTFGIAGMFENMGAYEASLRVESMALNTGNFIGTIINIAAVVCIVFIVMKKPLEVPFVKLVMNKPKAPMTIDL